MSDEKKSVKQNMIYNTVGSIIYYVCQWLMTVLVVRLSGYEDAGLLSIAMSVTAAPAIVGLFNIRSYQVSDINNEFFGTTYTMSRLYTNILSYIICIIMVITGGYNLQKATVILIFMIFKVAEGFADVYYGIEQKFERLDYAGISLAIRGVGTIVLFSVTLIFLKNLLLSIIMITAFSFLVIILMDRHLVKKIGGSYMTVKTTNKEIKKLLIVCVPLAVVAFLNNLSINIPKIYLERYFGSEIMGIYASIASPTVVIQLAATTVFAPLVPVLTEQYNMNKKKEFLNTVKKFSMLVAGLSVICIIASKLLAAWGLRLLFGESIEPYTYLFVPVILVSIMIAINACLFSVCTLLRVIRQQYIIGIGGVLMSEILALTLVKNCSMEGVVYASIGTMIIQIIIQLVLIINKMRKSDE